MRKEFVKVEQLSYLQEEQLAEYREGKIDNRHDFHSYKTLLTNEAESQIDSHNTRGIRAKALITFVRKQLSFFIEEKDIKSIGDMGGGAGFLAQEWKLQLQDAEVYSYDISKDAGTYGKEHFPGIHFVTKAIDVNDSFLKEKKFSVIFANEFYPFTRTDDYEYQKKYIQTFLDNLEAGGCLVVGLVKTECCLLNHYDKLKKDYRINRIKRVRIPALKLLVKIRFLWLSDLVSQMMCLFHLRRQDYLIILQK